MGLDGGPFLPKGWDALCQLKVGLAGDFFPGFWRMFGVLEKLSGWVDAGVDLSTID